MVATSGPEELGWGRRMTVLSVLFWKPSNWAKSRMFGTGNKGVLKAWEALKCGSLEAVDTKHTLGAQGLFPLPPQEALSQGGPPSGVQPG